MSPIFTIFFRKGYARAFQIAQLSRIRNPSAMYFAKVAETRRDIEDHIPSHPKRRRRKLPSGAGSQHPPRRLHARSFARGVATRVRNFQPHPRTPPRTPFPAPLVSPRDTRASVAARSASPFVIASSFSPSSRFLSPRRWCWSWGRVLGSRHGGRDDSRQMPSAAESRAQDEWTKTSGQL